MSNDREQLGWKDPRIDPPPYEAAGLAVQVRITCTCGRGGRAALTAGRMRGEWVISHFDHAFEIEYWLKLPDFKDPQTGRSR